MHYYYQALWIIAQADSAESAPAPAGGEAAAGDGAAMAAPSLIEQILGNPLNLILFSGVLFILLVLRPQQKQMKQLQQSLANLKKNDRVVTSSGIHGTVVQAGTGDPTVIVRIDENSGARITINRDSIARIVEEKEDSKDSKAS